MTNNNHSHKTGIVAKARLFLSTAGGKGIFGSGKWELLSAVEKHGSLRKAASLLGRSYRQAWGDINAAEKYLGFKLVTRSRGGADGGTMLLTPRGKNFLAAWESHNRRVTNEVEKSFRKYISDVLEKRNGASTL